jgi:uncharacterized protein YdaU (DUF1376 family)
MLYYERHLGDYARDTGHLSLLEHGVYGVLLDRYYSTEEPIPADQVYRIARARTKDEQAAVDTVLREFFTLADGVWRSARCDEEIAKIGERRQKAVDRARKGAEARWGDASSNADASEKDAPRMLEASSKHGASIVQALLADASLSPSSKKKQKKPEPADAEPGSPVSPKAGGKATGIDAWLAACEAAGEECIPAGDPIFRWAADAGIPVDYLELAWDYFVERHSGGKKRQADWRATFRNAVKLNWYKLWWLGADGTTGLTSAGLAAQRAKGAAVAA